jgi:oligoribonuclease (3'-5' exoribonuclease)
MNFAQPQIAIFLDTETTGLVPNAPGAALLEIGMLAVEVPSFREIDSWSSVIVELDRLDDPLKGADDYVRKMHAENGLEKDLRAAIAGSREPGWKLPRLFDVQQAAIAFYNKHASGRRVYLGGSKPDFDRDWLDHHMPALVKKFHYRGFDTNAFFILREYLVGVEKSGQRHRVLDDCRQCVSVVHEHFNLMKALFGPKR